MLIYDGYKCKAMLFTSNFELDFEDVANVVRLGESIPKSGFRKGI